MRTQTGSFCYARYQLKRSILENALQNNYTFEDYEAGLKFFGGCAFCGTPKAPRKDHLVAVFQCGDFVRQNVVPACQECDDSKGRNDYHDWMLYSNSEKSLRRRRMTMEKIKKRIKMIETWQSGYKCLQENTLFGENYPEYLEILKQMDSLCEKAEILAAKARSRHFKRELTAA
jgi:hypothetical protein